MAVALPWQYFTWNDCRYMCD